LPFIEEEQHQSMVEKEDVDNFTIDKKKLDKMMSRQSKRASRAMTKTQKTYQEVEEEYANQQRQEKVSKSIQRRVEAPHYDSDGEEKKEDDEYLLQSMFQPPRSRLSSNASDDTKIITVIASHQSRMICLFNTYFKKLNYNTKTRFMNCAICSLTNNNGLRLNLVYDGILNNKQKDYFEYKKPYWCKPENVRELNNIFHKIVFGKLFDEYLINNLREVFSNLKKCINEGNRSSIINRMIEFINRRKLKENQELTLKNINDTEVKTTINNMMLTKNKMSSNEISQHIRRTYSELGIDLTPKEVSTISKKIDKFLQTFFESNLNEYNKFIAFEELNDVDSPLSFDSIDTMYFVRHGEGIHNIADKIFGMKEKYVSFSKYLDAQLTEDGKRQAELASEALSKIIKDKYDIYGFASDLQRTQQTLDIIGEKIKLSYKIILPCSHEISAKEGECDNQIKYKYTNAENKTNINLDKLSRENWNVDFYREFYGNNTRNNRVYNLVNKGRKMVNSRQHCKDTDMIIQVINICNKESEYTQEEIKNYFKKLDDERLRIENDSPYTPTGGGRTRRRRTKRY
jgi:hypothetical protein